MTAHDLAIGTTLVAAGVATIGLIVSPMVSLKGTSQGPNVIAERWFETPIAPKADLLVAIAEPSLLDPAPIGPRDGDQIEQAVEHKTENEKEHKRDVTEPEELCSRHGMHRKYFRRHHHQMWRCVKHGR